MHTIVCHTQNNLTKINQISQIMHECFQIHKISTILFTIKLNISVLFIHPSSIIKITTKIICLKYFR